MFHCTTKQHFLQPWNGKLGLKAGEQGALELLGEGIFPLDDEAGMGGEGTIARTQGPQDPSTPLR